MFSLSPELHDQPRQTDRLMRPIRQTYPANMEAQPKKAEGWVDEKAGFRGPESLKQ